MTAAALTAALLLAVAQSAEAASVATLQTRVDQARAQAQSLASAVRLQTARLRAAAAEAGAARRRQRALKTQLARGVRRARRLEVAVTVEQARLSRVQGRFRRAQRQLAGRLVAIYKSDTPDVATILLEADGLRDLMTRVAYLKDINAADGALVEWVEELRDAARASLQRLRSLRAQAAAEVTRVATARNAVARVRAAAESRTAALRRARAAQASSLAAIRSRMAGWTAQVRALQRASGVGGAPGYTVGRWFDGFAIPKSIVMCESGGNYKALNPTSGAGGAYQLLPETYRRLGGKYKAPNLAPKSEQDRLAGKLWNGGRGRGNWAC